MKSTVRKIGNSRGILIAAPFLAACEIEDEIELQLDGKRIIIEPIRAIRAGWFDDYQPNNDVEAWSGLVETETERDEWLW